MNAIGPIIDGHVEIPIGSGVLPSGGYFGDKEQIAATVAVDENGQRWELGRNGDWSFVVPGSVWRNHMAGPSGWEVER